MKDISVVIPCYNSPATITHTLDGLLAQPRPLLREIIVVDSSDDGKTPEILARYADRVRVVHLEKKTMPASGRNIGAELASGDTLAFIDADAFPAPDWIEKISEARESGGRVGGGSVLVPDFQKKNRLALAQYFLQFNEFTDAGRTRAVKFVPSVNLFCEKKLFFEIGGFPEIRASEDVLFGLKAGAVTPVSFHPEARVFHIFRTELKAYLRNQKMLGRYILIYRRQHYGGFLYKAWAAIPLLPLFFMAKLGAIASRVWRGKKKDFPAFLSSSPLFLAGLFYWSAGFFQGSLQKETL